MKPTTRLRRAWHKFWLSRAGETVELAALAAVGYLLLRAAEWLLVLLLAHGLWHIWLSKPMAFRRVRGRRVLVKEKSMKFTSHVKAFLTRPRAWFLWLGLLVSVTLSWLTAPETGLITLPPAWAKIVDGFVSLSQVLWAIGLAHWTRKALFDYRSARMEDLFADAKKGSTGAGLAILAQVLVFAVVLLAVAGRARAAELPPGFHQYGAALKTEQQHYWPDHAHPHWLAGQVEQESCISLKSPRCWNPRAQLKTQREEGAGMPQLTRAYRADGSLRFDALTSLAEQYGTELAGLTWNSVYSRADLQLRALVLMSRDATRPFIGLPGGYEMGMAGYNGGPGDIQRARRVCGMTAGCNPGEWWGNVELHCVKSRKPLYGDRSACDINTEYPRLIVKVRAAKYEAPWGAL